MLNKRCQLSENLADLGLGHLPLSSLSMAHTLPLPPGNTSRLPDQLAMQGTILPGVTRKSVIQLLQDEGYKVEETNVTVSEAMEADEVFTTGTAVVVCAVGSLTYKVASPICSLQLAHSHASCRPSLRHPACRLRKGAGRAFQAASW